MHDDFVTNIRLLQCILPPFDRNSSFFGRIRTAIGAGSGPSWRTAPIVVRRPGFPRAARERVFVADHRSGLRFPGTGSPARRPGRPERDDPPVSVGAGPVLIGPSRRAASDRRPASCRGAGFFRGPRVQHAGRVRCDRCGGTRTRRERVRIFERSGAPGRIRTPNPLIRSQVLCPVELRAHLVWGVRPTRRRGQYSNRPAKASPDIPLACRIWAAGAGAARIRRPESQAAGCCGPPTTAVSSSSVSVSFSSSAAAPASRSARRRLRIARALS